MARTLTVLLVLLLTGALSASGQARTYAPSEALPTAPTREIMLVFFSTSSCVGNRHPDLGSAVRSMKTMLSQRARQDGTSFSAVGVAAEWSIADGLNYLLEGVSTWENHDFGAWDEVQAGRNWLNASALKYVWRDPDGAPTVPQVILVERVIGLDGNRIAASADRAVLRLAGSDEITQWVIDGMPLPAVDP